MTLVVMGGDVWGGDVREGKKLQLNYLPINPICILVDWRRFKISALFAGDWRVL